MKDRIKKIRKNSKLTQVEFGERIGVKGNTVTGYETGLRNPTDAVLRSICREFRVNESWLRTGEGDMFQELPPEDEVAAAISNVLEDINCDNSVYTLIKEFLLKYDRLDPKSKKVINEFADSIIDECMKKREER